MLTHDQMNILPSIIAELISLIKTPDREMSTLAVTYCVAAQYWSKYHCYKHAPSSYDLRCLEAPLKQTNNL